MASDLMFWFFFAHFLTDLVEGYYCDSERCLENEYCCGDNICCVSYTVWELWYFCLGTVALLVRQYILCVIYSLGTVILLFGNCGTSGKTIDSVCHMKFGNCDISGKTLCAVSFTVWELKYFCYIQSIVANSHPWQMVKDIEMILQKQSITEPRPLLVSMVTTQQSLPLMMMSSTITKKITRNSLPMLREGKSAIENFDDI
ncbi:unnamed protein product [Mytilus edulis]|uniref:Uncharacterized protein n=1 Tax=Mytilus edulis TaxID=6550 RepID=A0A8S3QHA0_MYTED|nr:unnamed protein product [Mytilus edulis]